MKWHEHLTVKGQHAFLSPSRSYWVNYDSEKLRVYYDNYQRTVLGTRLHALAEECIRLSVRLPNTTTTLNMFVNDAIGFRMDTEQPLWFSENAFGTADAISFYDNTLRIHDLKTGTSPGKMSQLDIYAALFCLEYGIEPKSIIITLRIYQNDEVLEWSPLPESIKQIMEVIIHHDMVIESMKG